MWLSRLGLKNIKSFVGEHSIELSKNINVIVGHNNSGKSTILQSLLMIQNERIILNADITLDKTIGEIHINIEEPSQGFSSTNNIPMSAKVIFDGDRDNDTIFSKRGVIENKSVRFYGMSIAEPNNFIYPYESKRKVNVFDERITEENSKNVSGDLRYLNSKIDNLVSSSGIEAKEFKETFESIFGFPVSTVTVRESKKAGYEISLDSHIFIDKMGEGVSNISGLLVALCRAKNKLFLIEEPENDIHPKALKDLLRLIEKKSANNQFVISTHSNIVTKYLGSITGAKVFKVSMEIDKDSRLPQSKIEEVENEPTARLQLLEDLGYEPFDFSQWKGWLILEESSAEVVIRDFLIPAFCPELENKLRTYSAKSRDEVEHKFKDFENLFVFIHLEKIYKNKAWVIIDGGPDEEKIINRMKEDYKKSDWNENNFLQFKKHDFEKYYPNTFKDRVEQVLGITEKKDKRKAKQELINDLKQWWKDNPETAKKEFEKSAKEVIEKLKLISKQLK